jgi:hypothetical protein
MHTFLKIQLIKLTQEDIKNLNKDIETIVKVFPQRKQQAKMILQVKPTKLLTINSLNFIHTLADNGKRKFTI